MRTTLILSGGMDSAVLLYQLLRDGHTVSAISFDYGQRHRKELGFALKLTETVGVPWRVIDLSGIKGLLTGSSQTDPTVPVPIGRYDEPTMKKTIVPNRNMMMLAIAGAVAISNGDEAVAYAAHAGDHAIYPDCREEFVLALNAAFELCDWQPLKLIAPFLNLDKGDIARRGVGLGVPFALTWTCYVGGDEPCGQCGACTERAEAFAKAGIKDPLL